MNPLLLVNRLFLRIFFFYQNWQHNSPVFVFLEIFVIHKCLWIFDYGKFIFVTDDDDRWSINIKEGCCAFENNHFLASVLIIFVV